MTALRYIAIAVSGLVGLAVLAAGALSLVFDPDRYKPDLVRIVHEKTGRMLAIEGTIVLTFLPYIGVAAERLALSGPGGEGRFASIGQAKVTLALLPLFGGRIVADHLDLSDVSVELVQRSDGTTNFDDFAGGNRRQTPAASPRPPADPVTSLATEISEIRLRNANIVWRDEASGRSLRVAGLDAKIGAIAEGARGQLEIATRVESTKPQVNLRIDGSGGYRLDFAKGAFALHDLDLRLQGDAHAAAGLVAKVTGDIEVDPARKLLDIARLTVAATTKDGFDLKASVPKLRLHPSGAAGEAASAELKIVRSTGTLKAKIDLSQLTAGGRQVRFEHIALDAEAGQGETSLVAKLASPLAIDFDTHTVELASLTGDLGASGPGIPGTSTRGSISGSASLAWGKPSSARVEVAARLDDSNLKLKIVVADFDKPAIQFDVTADRLDLSHFFPSVPPSSAVASAAGGGAAATPTGGMASAPEQAIDLAQFRKLNANGSVRIASLAVRQIKAQNIHLGVRAADGQIEISPFSANLYQGTLAGSASVNLNNRQLSIRQQLSDVALGALLRDAAAFDRLEGRGDVALNLTTTGTTLAAAKRALVGNVRVDVRDGAVKGVNLGAIATGAGSLLGMKSVMEGTAKASDQTEFSQLSGSFAIDNGVARNNDLVGQSPLLKVTGAGSIDIGAARIDYLVKVTPVGAIPVGGRRTLTVLRGVAVPIRIVGPLAAPEYSVDLAQLAVESARTGVKLSIGAAVGVPEAVPMLKEWLHGLRQKK